MAPRVFQHETLPSGPSWDVVQDIPGAVTGDRPIAIRDHAILMLFAVYGVRSREVAHLQLRDIDCQRETIVFTRAKLSGSHSFPLCQSVGAAIISYLKEVRPKSPFREVFLTMHAPIGPISGGAMWAVASRQLRPHAASIKHHGPHSLRHACATRLINQALSLKMNLQNSCEQYAAFRKTLGERFEVNRSQLKAFCRGLGQNIDIADVSAEQVNTFLAGKGSLTANWHGKYNALVDFTGMPFSRGLVATSPLPLVIPKRPPAFQP